MKVGSIRFTQVVFSAVIVTVISAAAFAQGGGRLVGTWDATVTLRNCETGEFIRSFASIASFSQGGTSIGSTAGLPQSSRTPEHGVWSHVSGNLYRFKFKSFNFGPIGPAISYTIVEHDLELNKGGDT
jgi:hypothetical protein